MPRGSNLRSNSTNPSAISPEVYVVVKDGLEQRVHILKRRAGKALVQYLDKHEQGDKWVQESDIRENKGNGLGGDSSFPRKLRSSAASPPVRQASIEPSTNIVHETATQEDTAMTEDDFNFQDSERKPVRAPRNIDKVNFGHWQIKTWYFSPYPLAESEAEDPGTPGMTTSAQSQRIQSINRSTVRSHGRASDLLTGGSGRMHLPLLWVCNRCFKYMAEGVGWELHIKSCTRKHPPGRKVYQRGAHTIWEVDGAKEKVYCQNLSLFGKLFIDVKTLFFDCDNFLFYLMTDGDSQRDHVLGFFSKEKMSYDDYNLACIITLPPYQRKGYGMLMIEFSYELSRRAGKVGTPERPLSDLGLRTYLTYWISTLVGFFRRLLSFMPPDIAKIDSLGKNSGLRSLSRELDDGTPRLRKKRYKGWEGEVIEPNPTQTPTDDHLISSLREIETTLNADGSATSHVIVRCTLADIARATNLRTEDVAFALHECGLLSRSCSDEENSQDVIAISREMVEVVAKERRVRKPCLDHDHVLLSIQ